MENGFGFHRQQSSVWRSLRDGDFEEEDVWEVFRDQQKHSSFKLDKSIISSISEPRNIPSPAAMIPNGNINIYHNSNSSHEAHKLMQQSPPVNFPRWPKTYRTNKSNESSRNSGFSDDEGNDGGDGEYESEEDDDCGSEYNHKMPPHEVIAKRLARSQISSFSVFEGVGRTLKGRDLSKVRNAVLTKTGFLESP